ncbi:hypothetical protein [Pyrobaculum neutrophilum]|nr:hypothetical protein [Pyrobaculum neutrophilum]
MAVAEADVETIRCILGLSRWDLCLRLKNLRRDLEELEARLERLAESL